MQVISGQLPDPPLRANGILVDWLLRLVIGRGRGFTQSQGKDLVRGRHERVEGGDGCALLLALAD